jgi:hypothetical protein
MFRVRVSWGRLENFKCVDYFQIEYYEKSNMAATVKENCSRHGTVLFARSSFELFQYRQREFCLQLIFFEHALQHLQYSTVDYHILQICENIPARFFKSITCNHFSCFTFSVFMITNKISSIMKVFSLFKIAFLSSLFHSANIV